MTWYSENPAQFPAAVQRVTLPEGTLIAGTYRIRHPLCVSGTELYYCAENILTEEEVSLCELLPLRWCMPDEAGCFVPYQTDAETQWNLAKERSLARLEQLQANPKKALPDILQIFEDRGTLWYAAKLREERALSKLLSEKLIAPNKAVDLLAPLITSLEVLHQKGLYHGNITPGAVRLYGTHCELRDWNSYEGKPDARTDVQAISRLLWQLMTGETEYRSLTAASLPGVIRNALYNGFYDPDMTIGTLWEQLHAAKPAARVRNAVAPTAKSSGMPKWLIPLGTAVFCVACLAVPLLLRHSRIQEKPAVTASVSKMPDVSYALSAGELRMPELLYLPQEEAVAQLESMGLGVILAKREDNPVVPINSVVTQKPDAGAIVKAGDVVTLSISDGWTNYVPDVCNMLLDKATERLEALGFIVEYEEIVSPGDAPGTVITQDIKPETKLERDSIIHLTVSLGRKDLDPSKMEEVGDYVGMDFEEAKALLSEIFLYAMQTETVYDPEIPAGVIISQDIPEGRKVPQGTIVNMKVSMGVQTTRVPGVVMMGANAAREVLETAGLKCILCYVSDTHVIDYVLSQNVAAGSLVPVGTEVWLNVSVGSASYVVSTGGWSGNPLPSMDVEETTEETTETEKPSEPEDSTPEPTDPPETDPDTTPTSPPTAPPTEATQPPATDPIIPDPPTDPPAPPVADPTDEELTHPPMPGF